MRNIIYRMATRIETYARWVRKRTYPLRKPSTSRHGGDMDAL